MGGPQRGRRAAAAALRGSPSDRSLCGGEATAPRSGKVLFGARQGRHFERSEKVSEKRFATAQKGAANRPDPRRRVSDE
ncbi:hypothetical protein [Ferrovum sp.]|uniref:hypothetical protein n=1 Tax=Ferrovum sp. TaxID=2609467 RepID=UPI0026140C23|nr:hypothetical protein [Ferrovum sp.]